MSKGVDRAHARGAGQVHVHEASQEAVPEASHAANLAASPEVSHAADPAVVQEASQEVGQGASQSQGLALALPQGPEDPEDPGLALAPSPKLAPHPAHLQGPQVHPLQGLKDLRSQLLRADRPNQTSGVQADPHHSEALRHAVGLQDQGQALTQALIQTPQALVQVQTQTRSKVWRDCVPEIRNYKYFLLRGL